MKIYNLLFSIAWCQEEKFTNDFVIEIDASPQRVYELAAQNHFDVKEEIFPGHWHLRSKRINRRSTGDEGFHRNVIENIFRYILFYILQYSLPHCYKKIQKSVTVREYFIRIVSKI